MFEDIFEDILPDPKKSITDKEKHEDVFNSGVKEDIWRSSPDPDDVWNSADTDEEECDGQCPADCDGCDEDSEDLDFDLDDEGPEGN